MDVYVRGDRFVTSLYHYLSNVLSLSHTLTKTCYKLCVTGVIRLTVTFVSERSCRNCQTDNVTDEVHSLPVTLCLKNGYIFYLRQVENFRFVPLADDQRSDVLWTLDHMPVL